MKKAIDDCTALTGWAVTAPSTISVQTFDDYISGYNSGSLLIYFSALDSVRTAVKTLTAIDITGYSELTFSIYSFRNQNNDYKQASDFFYNIKIEDTAHSVSQEFYFPTYKNFTHVTIGLSGITKIDKITITPLFTTDDYLIISNILVSTDQIPADVFIGIQDGINTEIIATGINSILLGTVNTTVGDTQLTFTSDPNWIDRYSAILITDGSHSEYHQIANRNDDVFTFTELLDGTAIKNTFVNASVYLYFPVLYGKEQEEIVLPSITIWGLAPEFIYRGSKLELIDDTWSVATGAPAERREGQIKRYSILIDCEARQNELLVDMSQAVSRFLGKELLWINGKRHEVITVQTAVEVLPINAEDIIPKIQYTCTVEVKEELFARVNQVKMIAETVTVEILNT